MNAQHLTYSEALNRAALRRASTGPVKSEPHCRGAATKRAQFLALRDARIAELRGER